MKTVQQMIDYLSQFPLDAPLVTGEGDYFELELDVVKAESEEDVYVTTDRRGHDLVVEVKVL